MIRRFTKKIQNLLKSPEPDDPVRPNFLEKRLHRRFNLQDFPAISAMLPNGSRVPIRDISFSGFSTIVDPPISYAGNKSIHITINFLGRSCDSEAIAVHTSEKGSSGFSFVHFDASTLTFLLTIIEDLRCGYSTKKLDTSILKEKYQTPFVQVYRGDGPTDIIVKETADGGIEEGTVTFREGERYGEVVLANRTLNTRTAQDLTGRAQRMTNDATPDQEKLRKAAQILLGAYALSQNPAMRQWIELIIDNLAQPETAQAI